MNTLKNQIKNNSFIFLILSIIIISILFSPLLHKYNKSERKKSKDTYEFYEYGENVIFENDSVKIYIKQKNKW
jgi:hypothetical protein